MADNLNVTPGTGATVAADDIGGGVLVQRVKPVWGVDGVGTDVTATTPLPVREPVRGTPLGTNAAAITPGATSGTVAAANASRVVIEVSNGSGSGIWLGFGGAAVANRGTYLPSKATGYWYTTASVTCILETGGTGEAKVGYTEW